MPDQKGLDLNHWLDPSERKGLMIVLEREALVEREARDSLDL